MDAVDEKQQEQIDELRGFMYAFCVFIIFVVGALIYTAHTLRHAINVIGMFLDKC
jgi:hypothetical protein